MRFRSIEPDDPRSVIAEMKQLKTKQMGSVFFYDDNFNANPRRTTALLENMIRADAVPRTWTAQVRATEIIRDRDLLKLMRRTNCAMVYMGLESVNPATLAAYNKKQSVEQIVEAVRLLREYGIRAHGMFVLGADEDTVATIRATAGFAIRNDVSTVQFMILTPLPGTRYFQMLHDQGRILDLSTGATTMPTTRCSGRTTCRLGSCRWRRWPPWRGSTDMFDALYRPCTATS